MSNQYKLHLFFIASELGPTYSMRHFKGYNTHHHNWPQWKFNIKSIQINLTLKMHLIDVINPKIFNFNQQPINL